MEAIYSKAICIKLQLPMPPISNGTTDVPIIKSYKARDYVVSKERIPASKCDTSMEFKNLTEKLTNMTDVHYDRVIAS